MGLTNHLSCLSDAFSSYRVSFSLIYLIFSTNLTMMGLDPGPLVRLLVVLVDPLVMPVA